MSSEFKEAVNSNAAAVLETTREEYNELTRKYEDLISQHDILKNHLDKLTNNKIDNIERNIDFLLSNTHIEREESETDLRNGNLG